jgi:transposase
MIDPKACPRRLSGQVAILFNSQSVYDSLVPSDHPLRLIKDLVDFSSVRQIVRDRRLYSDCSGRYAIDPELFVKLCVLMTLESVSLRETERRAGTDLCWKFFLDLEVTDPAPFDFSTLSATRRLYGAKTCQQLAAEVLRQAAQAGVLVDDIIFELNRRSITDAKRFEAIAKPLEAQTKTVTVQLLRGKTKYSISFTP